MFTPVFHRQASDLTDHMYAVGVTGVVFGVIGVVCSVSALFTLRGSTWGSPPAQSLTLLWIGFAFNEGVSPGVKVFLARVILTLSQAFLNSMSGAPHHVVG